MLWKAADHSTQAGVSLFPPLPFASACFDRDGIELGVYKCTYSYEWEFFGGGVNVSDVYVATLVACACVFVSFLC
jgi:hypothetical protein